MMGIGFSELLVILIIIMIIFGAGKLPQIGTAFGQSIRNFKKSMKEAEELDQAQETETAAAPANPQEAPAEGPASGQQPAPAPAAVASGTQPAPASKEAPAASNTAGQGQKPQKGKGKGKEEKSFEEELIEQAIKEIKDKRIGTIRTPHDGLVQQGDVFTQSVERTPWHLKGRDRGVSRDLF